MRHIGLIAACGLLGACSSAAPRPSARPDDVGGDEPPVSEPRPAAAVKVGSDIPDRVSLETDSPFYFAAWRRLGVRINGGESVSVVEFCVSEGWARCQIFHGGRPKQERGRFATVTRRGTIDPYWRGGR